MAVFTGNGSAATPSFTFSSDTDTGFYRPSANKISVAASGGEIVAFESGTAPKINTFTSSDGIHYRGTIDTATGNGDKTAQFQFLKNGVGYHNFNVSADDFIISPRGTTSSVFDANGIFVHGDDAPTFNVYEEAVTGTGRTPYLQVKGATAGSAGLSISTFNTATSTAEFYAPQLWLAHSRSGTVGTTGGLINDGQLLGSIVFSGDNGTDFAPGAAIQSFVDGTPSASTVPAELRFLTTSQGNATSNTRFQIQANGQAVTGGASSVPAQLAISTLHRDGTASGSGVYAFGIIPSTATTRATYYNNLIQTAAASFTCDEVIGYSNSFFGLGAGSAITNLYGFNVNANMTGGTNNFGYYSNIAVGTGRWNFYANGTALNHFGNSLKIGGTATRSTTDGTNQLVLFNGTAPVGTLTNGVSFYASAGEARVMDAAGNSTLLSPHDKETNEWIYDSVYTPTGKRLRIRMEAMMKALNEHFGWDFVEEA